MTTDEAEEKERLIQQVLELQNTLDGNNHSVDGFDIQLMNGPLSSKLESNQFKFRATFFRFLFLPCLFADLSNRVDGVKSENFKLKSENHVLGQYIENLMSASSVFQSTSPKAGKKKPHQSSNTK